MLKKSTLIEEDNFYIRFITLIVYFCILGLTIVYVTINNTSVAKAEYEQF